MAHQGSSSSSSGSGFNKVLKDFVLGGTSGAIAKTLAAPIERVKLLLQTQENNPKLMERPYKGNYFIMKASSIVLVVASKRKVLSHCGEAIGPTFSDTSRHKPLTFRQKTIFIAFS